MKAMQLPSIRWRPWAVPVVALLAWAWLDATHRLPADFFPSPAAVLEAGRQELVSGRLARDVAASLYRVLYGFAGATLLGVPVGIWLGLSARAREALLPAVNFFRSLSPIAWIPFAVLWFGLGDAPAFFLIAMATAFPVVVATAAAVAGIPRVTWLVAEDFGFRGPALWTRVVLPAILPALLASLRLALGMAWVVLVAAEMIAGRDGLGFSIWDARNGLRADLLVFDMLVIGAIGAALDAWMRGLAGLPSVRWGHER
jgi:NitT/TauT family transport system permease protein